MQYEYTEAELNGLSGDETADEEAQAEWERQAYHHDEEAPCVFCAVISAGSPPLEGGVRTRTLR